MCIEADQVNTVKFDGPVTTFYVDARDLIIRKIFDAGLVNRRQVRRAAHLTMEEAEVLETIVPLNTPAPAGA